MKNKKGKDNISLGKASDSESLENEDESLENEEDENNELLMKEILQMKIKIMNQTLNYQMMNKRKNILLKMIRTQKIKQFQSLMSLFSNQKRIMKH